MSNQTLETKCIYCDQVTQPSTRKPRRFCSKKCKNAYHIRLESTKQRAREKYLLERQRAINYYGGKCTCCLETTYEFLAFDHIDGNGNQDRKKNGTNLLVLIKRRKYPDTFRILCHNCNLAIGFYGYCPHGKL